MENLLNELTKGAAEVRLGDGERSRIRERLLLHMHSHPIASPYQRFFGPLSPFASFVRKPVFIAPLLFLIVSGGVSSYAASGALPGDLLYPMKTGFVEPVKGLFALSDEAKAEWKILLTEKRLEEVEQLVAQKQLTSHERSKSEERVNNALGEARDTIQKLSEKNPGAAARIEATFSASLGAHQERLSSLGSTTPSADSTEAHSFVEFIKTEVAPRVQGTATSTPQSQKGGRKEKFQIDRGRD